jgi:TetR/AcrR family transcriptional regulator, transcriptional repressor for nem operon
MMRETAQRRSETRQRILDAAGLLFREHGIDGVGVDAVMRQAGLTHGGFYLHFASKEALATEVAQSLLENAALRWDGLSRHPDQQEALRQIVGSYLDPTKVSAHTGCPLTTLGPDVARRSASRGALAGALRGMLDALTRCVSGATAERRRQRAVTALATMVGAVVLARVADDPALADEFLATATAELLDTAGS